MATIKKRQVKQKDEYTKQLTAMRKQSPRHVVEVELETSSENLALLLAANEDLRIIRNTILGVLYKNYKQMVRTKKYKQARKDYADILKRMQFKNIDKKELKVLENQQKDLKNLFVDMQKEFNVTFEFARKYEEKLRTTKFNKADAVLGWSVCEHLWGAIEKLLYGKAKTVSFIKKGEFVAFQGKQAERCIILKQEISPKPRTVGKSKIVLEPEPLDSLKKWHVTCLKTKLPLMIKKDDLFIQETLSHIEYYNQYSDTLEREYVASYMAKTNQPVNTYRICTNRIVIKQIRGRKRLFLQITLEGNPVPKRKKDGSFRHSLGVGRVGVDIGTQSIAYTTKDTVVLKNLAERSKGALAHEHKIWLIQRVMDRSKRTMNPNKYNKNGTINTKNKEPWVYSSRYKKLKAKYQAMHRKAAINRKLAHREDVNKMRALGDHIIIEPMRFSGLQKKAKEVTKNKKGKFNRRKRFGKSILRRSPATLVAELKYRFKLTNGLVSEVDNYSYKASQYDHTTENAQKKGLSKRWHTFDNGLKVQRDLYSSFLLYCSEPNLKQPNPNMCNLYFEQFLKHHENCIQTIKNNKIKVLNSGISIA